MSERYGLSEYPELEQVIDCIFRESIVSRPYEYAPPPYSESTPGLAHPRHEYIAPLPPPAYSEDEPPNSELPQPIALSTLSSAFFEATDFLAELGVACRSSAAVDTPRMKCARAIVGLFGIKCANNLVDSCTSTSCDHTLRSAAEVVTELMKMVHSQNDFTCISYTLTKTSRPIFEAYFTAYVAVFASAGMGLELLEMLKDCRLFNFNGAASIRPIFTALKSMGMESQATQTMMSNLCEPEEALTFKAATITVLEVLASSNWYDYVSVLVMLTKRYDFVIPTEILKTILYSTFGKRDWKTAAIPLLEIIPSQVAQRADMLGVIQMLEKFQNSPVMMGENEDRSSGQQS
ncbi:protein deadlock-like [Drosophila guanche]|uniref:Blast:Protein deadlock n=1 Tax=Drosophila guanche TaxID=7266 RepID=A0A3B0KAQ0_DROGU|nr:protein deadlock-like [Drosophila guanche]SPP82121.1 blast:Protein deadlock [Drosophila guanche]